MKYWLSLLVSFVFGISAFMKLIDFENTVIYFHQLLGFNLTTIKLGLVILIISEITIAFSLPINWKRQRIIQNFTILLLVIFLGSSFIMSFLNVKNCGCLGTRFMTSPYLTLLKNLTLIFAIFLIIKK